MATDAPAVVTETKLPDHPVRRGKVRDIYDLGSEILLVATDRISAYDVVLPTPIPRKGAMLTRISEFWFRHFEADLPHHLIEVLEDQAPAGLDDYLPQLRGRTMRCRKTKVVPIECVVRGYLGRVRLEGLSADRSRVRDRITGRDAAMRQAAGTDLHAVDESGRGARREYFVRAGLRPGGRVDYDPAARS